MTDVQRKRVFDALMGPEREMLNSKMRGEFAEMVLGDIARIEPLIDIFICEGKIEATAELRDRLLEGMKELKGGSLAIPNHA